MTKPRRGKRGKRKKGARFSALTAVSSRVPREETRGCIYHASGGGNKKLMGLNQPAVGLASDLAQRVWAVPRRRGRGVGAAGVRQVLGFSVVLGGSG
jgi:hypothetical protein